jgi:hypothetical protein
LSQAEQNILEDNEATKKKVSNNFSNLQAYLNQDKLNSNDEGWLLQELEKTYFQVLAFIKKENQKILNQRKT